VGTLYLVIAPISNAPATGGSGGGGPNKNIWAKPEPQAILGLNSTVVFGGNVQVAFPINFQMAVGSNVQICISPNAWSTLYLDSSATTLPAEGNRILGSGLGGNMQLTMGTSANFVIGQSFDINLGPRRITLDVHNKTGIQACVRVIGTIILAASIVFLIAYGAISDDDGRAATVMIFQITMQVLLIVLMDTEKIYGKMDAGYQKAFEDTFVAGDQHNQYASTFVRSSADNYTLLGALEVTGIVMAMVLPVVLEIAGEVKLHDPDPQVVVDADGNQIGTVQ